MAAEARPVDKSSLSLLEDIFKDSPDIERNLRPIFERIVVNEEQKSHLYLTATQKARVWQKILKTHGGEFSLSEQLSTIPVLNKIAQAQQLAKKLEPQIRTWVNEELRQNGGISPMRWEFVSSYADSLKFPTEAVERIFDTLFFNFNKEVMERNPDGLSGELKQKMRDQLCPDKVTLLKNVLIREICETLFKFTDQEMHALGADEASMQLHDSIVDHIPHLHEKIKEGGIIIQAPLLDEIIAFAIKDSRPEEGKQKMHNRAV